MKYIMIFGLVWMHSVVFSQSEQGKQAQSISYGLFFSPTLNYRALTSNKPNDLVKEIRNQEEIAGIGYRAGVTVDYRFSDHLSLQSGFILASRLFKTAKQELIWPDDQYTGVTEAFISQQYLYLDIPLKIRYYLSPNRRSNWFISGGVNTALFFLYNRKNHVKISDSWDVSNRQSFFAHSLNFFAEIESGFEHKLSPHVILRPAIYVQYALIPTNSNLATKEFLYSGGASLGLIYTPFK